MTDTHPLAITVNGLSYDEAVEPRLTLADFLRDQLGLTGTKLGCEHGVCGACTVLLDGEAVRSCLLFAVQANEAEIVTVEGLAEGGGLAEVQTAFWDHHALQCGFCTPGFLMSVTAFLRDRAGAGEPTEGEIRDALGGNLCRCTGYHTIVEAVRSVAKGAQ